MWGAPDEFVRYRSSRFGSSRPSFSSFASTFMPASSPPQIVPRQARHASTQLIVARETGGAVLQGFGNVRGVRGQDEERPVALEDDAGVVVAAVARARLVRDLRAEREERAHT